jgi:hypothetical protein
MNDPLDPYYGIGHRTKDDILETLIMNRFSLAGRRAKILLLCAQIEQCRS